MNGDYELHVISMNDDYELHVISMNDDYELHVIRHPNSRFVNNYYHTGLRAW